MKKFLLTAAAMLAALVPTTASASQHGPFVVGQLNANTCAMMVQAPNGAFLMALDTSANMTVAATRPGFSVTAEEQIPAGLGFDGQIVNLVGIGLNDGTNGGVHIPLGNGQSFVGALDETQVLTVLADGRVVASVQIDNDFRTAALAMMDCTEALGGW